MLGMIRRSFSYLSKDVFLPLYKSLVRHHVESGAVLWSGIISRSQIRALEKVQMRALSMVQGMSDMDYEDQLKALRIPTLAARRSRGVVIEMWKHHYVYERDILTPSFKIGYSARRQLDCHRFEAKGKHANTFYATGAIAWNRIPREVREKSTLNSFKNALDKHWASALPQIHDFLSSSPWCLKDTD